MLALNLQMCKDRYRGERYYLGPRNHQVHLWLVHPFWLQWLPMRHTPLRPTPTRELVRRHLLLCTTMNGELALEPAGTRHGVKTSGGNEIDHTKLNKVTTTRMLSGRPTLTGRRPAAGPDARLVGILAPLSHHACGSKTVTGRGHPSGEGIVTQTVSAMQSCAIALAAAAPADHQSAS